MAKKVIGKYGEIFGNMPLGFGEEGWQSKIGQDYTIDVPDEVSAASPVKVGDMFGGMPAGFAYNSDGSVSQDYLTNIGQQFNPSTGQIGTPTIPETPGTPTIPPATEPPPVDPNAYVPPNVATPEIPNAVSTPSGADVALKYTPYGGRSSFISSYDPLAMDEQNKLALQSAKYGLLPTLQEELAGAREAAARASGEGGSSGLFSEFSRKPLERFTQTLTEKAVDLEQQKLAARQKDKEAKAAFDMEQDAAEKKWNREQTSNIMGAEYAQNLSDKEWDRENSYNVQQTNIQNAITRGEISRDQGWKLWEANNNERVRKLNDQRQDILLQLEYAQQEKMFDKQAALTREMKQVDKEIAQMQQDAAEDAAMWGAAGSVAGTGATLGLGKLFNLFG